MSQGKATLIIALIVIGILVVVSVRSVKQQRADAKILDMDYRYVIGIVDETNFKLKSATNTAEYTFWFNGQIYTSEDEYSKGQNRIVNVGSRFYVKVSVIDPSINYMLFDSIPEDSLIQPPEGWKKMPKTKELQSD